MKAIGSATIALVDNLRFLDRSLDVRDVLRFIRLSPSKVTF